MKNTILIRTCFLISLFLIVTQSFGQTDFKSKLFKDFVKTENGKYTAEENGFVVSMKANILEVKITASCPTSVMSRDNFILTFSSFGNCMIASALKNINDQGNEELVLVRRDKPIGPADITIQIEMNVNGLNYKVTAKGYQGSNTLTWDQFFFAN
jgi:hypothetical protein